MSYRQLYRGEYIAVEYKERIFPSNLLVIFLLENIEVKRREYFQPRVLDKGLLIQLGSSRK